MPPFSTSSRRRGTSRRRLQSLVDRWVGVNQRSAGHGQAQSASNAGQSIPASTESPSSRPISSKHLLQPAAHRPAKRASYAGHELSFPDLEEHAHEEYMYDSSGDESETGSIDHYHEQATLCTEKTGELTETTGYSSGTTTLAASFATAEAKKMSSSSGTEQESSKKGPPFVPLPMPELRRRVSAPPILGLTVETPSPTASKNVVASVPNTSNNDNILLSSEDSSIVSVAVDEETGTPSAVAAMESLASPPPAVRVSSSEVAAPVVVPREDTPRRQLRFNPKTNVYLHLHLDDYTEDELEASFVTDQDLSRVQLDTVQSILRMRAAAAADGNHAHVAENEQVAGEDADGAEEHGCYRGLESVATPALVEAHRAAKAAAVDAVMDEQDWQFMAEIYDEDRIAAACRQASADSGTGAILRGASDAVYVQRFVRTEEDDMTVAEEGDVVAHQEDVPTPQVEDDAVVFEASPSAAAAPPTPPPAAAAVNGNESLSSILQDAMNVSMHDNVEAPAPAPAPAPNDEEPRPNPSSLTRIGSRERLLDILGHLRSDMAEARTEFEEVSHVARRDSRRSSSSSSSNQDSHSSSSSDG